MLITQVMEVPYSVSIIVMSVAVNHYQTSTAAVHPVACPALLLLVSELAPYTTLLVPRHRVLASILQRNTIALTYPGADSV